MTMQMNAMGLIANGYSHVARYECFKKGERKFNIDCYTNNKEFVIKMWESGRRSYTLVYDNKDDANFKVKKLFSMYSFHKRIF